MANDVNTTSAPTDGASLQAKADASAQQMREFQIAMMDIQNKNAMNTAFTQVQMGVNDGMKEISKKVGDSASR